MLAPQRTNANAKSGFHHVHITRTYAPLLEAFSGLDGRLQDCMDIWRDAASAPEGGQPAIAMTEREYLYLIAACTRARDEKW